MIYKYLTKKEQILHESQFSLEITHFETEEEILIHAKDAFFPLKTFVDPTEYQKAGEIVFASNIVKAILIDSLKIATKPLFIIPSILTVMFGLNGLIERFNRVAFKIVSPYILKDWHKMKPIQELELFIFTFLVEYGVTEENAERFSEIIGHIIQSDSAYRLRLQDAITATNNLNVVELEDILCEREENKDIASKYRKFGLIARIALIVPELSYAWRKASNTIDISNLKLDDSDVYWASYITGYKFMGKTQEELKEYCLANGWTFPKI